jgi:hypothetical protein
VAVNQHYIQIAIVVVIKKLRPPADE